MPSVDVIAPVSSAPADRLALGVGWVRPAARGIGGNLGPSGTLTNRYHLICCACFEGNEE